MSSHQVIKISEGFSLFVKRNKKWARFKKVELPIKIFPRDVLEVRPD